MDPEEGQMRLPAGNDDKWPVKEETSGTAVVKEELEDGEIWRYGGSSTKNKPDFGKNPEPKTRKLIPPIEANSSVIQQGLNAEVKEEAEPFPAVIGYVAPPSSGQTSLPFPNGMSDNQVFNAHDFFTNQAIVKEELKEDEEELNDDERDHTADDGELEKEDEEEKVCPVDGCLETSSSEEALRTHMRTHPHPLICRVCQKTWPSAADLRRHYMVHSGEKPFQCEYCKKKFTEAGSLKRHIRHHTGEFPFECDLCDRKFASSSALNYHRGTHSQETMFACILCSFHGASVGSLTVHMLKHTGQKPFECADCGQCFSQKYTLERHKASVHLGIKKYSCPDCDHKSFRQSNLSDHIRRKHKK